MTRLIVNRLLLGVLTMLAVSVLIFIYSPGTRVASVAVVNINDAGFTAAAAAMASCIVAVCAVFKLFHSLVARGIARRTSQWRLGSGV